VIGLNELIIILLVASLFFGPKKLPEVARVVGEAVKEYRRALSEEPGEKTDEERIKEAARRLGIETWGKSTEAILGEVEKTLEDYKRKAGLSGAKNVA
jgi:TatA/E family protein of Tat protein translocase